MALNKYNMLKQSKTWKVKTLGDEKLIALTAQLKEAREKITELVKKRAKTSTQKGDPKKQNQKTDNEGSDPKKKKEIEPWHYKWKGTETMMEKDGKTYYWCNHHSYW
jgi:YHS domain-containing protein